MQSPRYEVLGPMLKRWWKEISAPIRRRRRRGTMRPQLATESLESRQMMHGEPILFGNVPYLTLSFAPDGTAVTGQQSTLFQVFDQIATTDQWQSTIVRAFQEWSSVTNADVGIVADNGSPLGTPGATVRDSRFGDIRVAAAPLAADIAAVAVSSDQPVAGSWIGDVVFNSNFAFASLDEIYAVALHEAGHVFGLEHSTDPESPMFAHGVEASRQLQPQDVLNIQALYGVRSPDSNETDKSNDTEDDATRLRFADELGPFTGETPGLVYGDLTTIDDVDVYELNLLEGYSGSITFRVRTNGISSMQPRVTVSRRNGTVLAEAEVTDIRGETLLFNIPSVGNLERLYLTIESDRTDVFGVGGYSIVTTYDDLLAVELADVEQAADGRFRLYPAAELRRLYATGQYESPLLDRDDVDDTTEQAIQLRTAPGFAQDTRYVTQSSIENGTDVDYFRIDTPSVSAGESLVGTIHIRSLEPGGLIPDLTLLDAQDQVIDMNVLVHGGGDVVVQIPNMDAERSYFLQVRAAESLLGHRTGNYELTVSFGPRQANLTPLATGQVTTAEPRQGGNLYVAKDQFFHFLVESEVTTARQDALLVTTITNDAGNVVFQLGQTPGTTRSGQVVRLSPGTYDIVVEQFVAGLPMAEPIPYQVSGFSISDPLGVPVDDPTGDPVFQCNGVEDAFCYPGGIETTDPFYVSILSYLSNTGTTLTNTTISTMFLGDWWDWLQLQQGGSTAINATNDSYILTRGSTLSIPAGSGVLSNDTTGPGEAILLSAPRHGTLLLQPDGSFSYEPDPNFSGTDQFVYITSEVLIGGGLATASLRVTPSGFGDATLDGRVDAADLAVWQTYSFRGPGMTWEQGDFDDDGFVDGEDFLVWLTNRFTENQPAPAARTRTPRAASTDIANAGPTETVKTVRPPSASLPATRQEMHDRPVTNDTHIDAVMSYLGNSARRGTNQSKRIAAQSERRGLANHRSTELENNIRPTIRAADNNRVDLIANRRQ